MKKTLYILAAALGMTSMAACSGSSNTDSSKDASDELRNEVYTGIIPAADCDGIRYSLKLDYDKKADDKSGKYDLDETYLQSDSTSTSGYKDLKSYKTKGDFTVMNGEGANAGKLYLKLMEAGSDTVKSSAAGPVYFLVDSDSTITMVNSDLELAASGLNYTLKAEK